MFRLKSLFVKLASIGILMITIGLMVACQPESKRKQSKKFEKANNEALSDNNISRSKEYEPIDIPDEPLQPEEINSLCSPSTFQIFTKRDYDGAQGTGSGFLIYPGYIATNLHVVDLNDDGIPDEPFLITVKLGKGDNSPIIEVKEVVAFDAAYDLAILKVSLNDVKGYKPLPLLNSYPKVGEDIYAIGNPLGVVSKNFTQGHVTQVTKLNEEGSPLVIVFDASISQGNSGGPLLNKFGVVVGIPSKFYVGYNNTAQNINIAIPSLHVIRLLKEALL
jgi:S1-C subfamily serine protease